MPDYCFRAEAGVDIDNFFTHLDLDKICSEKLGFEEDAVTTGGCCNFWADANLDVLLDHARRVSDGHVIVRTLRRGRYENTTMSDVRAH